MKQIKRLVLVNAPLMSVILLRLLFLLKTRKSKSVHTSVFSCCSLYCPVGIGPGLARASQKSSLGLVQSLGCRIQRFVRISQLHMLPLLTGKGQNAA